MKVKELLEELSKLSEEELEMDVIAEGCDCANVVTKVETVSSKVRYLTDAGSFVLLGVDTSIDF